MAHTCPECGTICHCCGDIDDIVFDHTEINVACRHWKECEEDDEEYWGEDDYDPTEGEGAQEPKEGGAA